MKSGVQDSILTLKGFFSCSAKTAAAYTVYIVVVPGTIAEKKTVTFWCCWWPFPGVNVRQNRRA